MFFPKKKPLGIPGRNCQTCLKTKISAGTLRFFPKSRFPVAVCVAMEMLPPPSPFFLVKYETSNREAWILAVFQSEVFYTGDYGAFEHEQSLDL